MDVHNLAIMFGPTLVRPQDSSILVMVRDNADQCRVVESVISHVCLRFVFFIIIYVMHVSVNHLMTVQGCQCACISK